MTRSTPARSSADLLGGRPIIRAGAGPEAPVYRLSVRIDGDNVSLDSLVVLFVNGVRADLLLGNQGATADWSSQVAPGTYVVSASIFTEGLPPAPVTRRVEITDGPQVVRFTLAELRAASMAPAARPAPGGASASLRVLVAAPGAQVLLDGAPMEVPQVTSLDAQGYRRSAPVPGAPFTRTDLPPGRYELDVTAPGYVALHQTIEVAAGASQQISLALEPVPRGLGALLGGGSPEASASRATWLLYGAGSAMALGACVLVYRSLHDAAPTGGELARSNPGKARMALQQGPFVRGEYVPLRHVVEDPDDPTERLGELLSEWGSSARNAHYEVVEIDPVTVWKQWKHGPERIPLAEAYRLHAKASQRKTVARYREAIRQGRPVGPVIVWGLDAEDGEVIDGFHRIGAMAMEGVRSALAVDLGSEAPA